MAVTDSFDILPGGQCAGRDLNAAIVDGATVEIRNTNYRPGHRDDVVTAVATVRYERDDHRNSYDDGQYCVARFQFVPPRPNVVGYQITFPPRSDTDPNHLGRAQAWGGSATFQPVDGKIIVTAHTCPDPDAPPERICGHG